MRNTDKTLIHYLASALCVSVTLLCIAQQASAGPQKRPQPLKVSRPIFRVSGHILKAISVASERYLKEEERQFSEAVKEGGTPVRCATEIQGYDVEVREERATFGVNFIPNSSCPTSAGGGAEVTIRKADFYIMNFKLGE